MGSSSVPSKMACWVALLSGVATLLTFNYYQLFWGVQFVFGMSVALATLFLKRGPLGIIITIPVAIATYVLWGQPYAGITYILEILLLTLIRNSPSGDRSLRRGTILIYDFVYWILLGAPIYYITYAYMSDVTKEAAFVLAQKSIVNGVMDTLIAYVIYAVATMVSNKRSETHQSISIQALALATIYSVIVFLSLFMVDKLYGSVMTLKGNTLYEDVKSFSSFIYDDMDEKVTAEIDFTLEHELRERNADAYYEGINGRQVLL